MTEPAPPPATPTTEDRLAALEVQAVQLRDRLSTLEGTAGRGLEDLGRALAELQARRPPVRQRLQEVEARLEAAGIPAVPESLISTPEEEAPQP